MSKVNANRPFHYSLIPFLPFPKLTPHNFTREGLSLRPELLPQPERSSLPGQEWCKRAGTKHKLGTDTKLTVILLGQAKMVLYEHSLSYQR